MLHLDLFSGIGGFALAVDTVWPNSEHVFCDNDKFCQAVLKKHWPNSYIYDDIRSIADTPNTGVKEMPKWEDEVFLLTGGFPCQPFSQAGRRKGTEDNRHLWPEMLRVIQLTKPTWIIAENVRGLLTIEQGLVFEQVCSDLEASGYEVQPLIIPAVAVNAPHRRDRVWFVANRTGKRSSAGFSDRKKRQILPNENRNASQDKQERNRRKRGVAKVDNDVKNTIGKRGRGWNENSRQVLGGESTKAKNARPSWETNWIEVATKLCSVDDGLPAELGDFTATKAGHRNAQLKAYGNAIVPQVAIEIMRVIKNITI